jgi:putative membrane protein
VLPTAIRRIMPGMEPLMAYLHYLTIILTGAFLTSELVICRPGLGASQVRLLRGLDVAFFVAALGALATGLLRLFFYAKGLAFYTSNPAFWAKMALYVVIALLSIWPTVRFIRWGRASGPPAAADVATVRRLLHVELALFALMPLLAVWMARGIGRS